MLAKYEWISTDKQFFGQPNTAYDFEAADMKEVSRRLAKMQEQKVSELLLLVGNNSESLILEDID